MNKEPMDMTYEEYIQWAKSRFPEWSDDRVDNTSEALAKTVPPDSCPVTIRSREDGGAVISPRVKGSY